MKPCWLVAVEAAAEEDWRGKIGVKWIRSPHLLDWTEDREAIGIGIGFCEREKGNGNEIWIDFFV